MRRGLRLVIYDESERKPVGWTWRIGVYLFKLFGFFDHVRGVRSWDEALAWLLAVSRNKPIADLRFWCHGGPGRVYLGGHGLSYLAFKRTSPYQARLQKLCERFVPNGFIWFRTCATFCGRAGHESAARWAQATRCRVAAHTYKIGVWHSGLHSIEPYAVPHWPTEEGVGEDGKATWSRPSAPHTIPFIWRNLPKGW